MTAELELRRLSVRFPGARHPAVDEVSLSVQPRELVGLIGESGSGKSTLMRALLGLVPSVGRVEWRGVDVAALSGAQRRQWRREVQPVFQDPVGALDPRFTVERTLREPYEIFGLDVPRGALEASLAEVGLEPVLLPCLPRQLSVGQCQRVSIARALALGPSTLVLDEPASALDVTMQGQLVALLSGLAERRRMSMLLVSHDLAIVRALATRVAVLHDGRLVEEGPTERVLSEPLHPLTQALVGRAEPRLAPRAEPPGCSFRARCPDAAPACGAPVTLRASSRDPSHRAACVKVA